MARLDDFLTAPPTPYLVCVLNLSLNTKMKDKVLLLSYLSMSKNNFQMFLVLNLKGNMSQSLHPIPIQRENVLKY